MTNTDRDFILGVLVIFKNIILGLIIAFLIIKTNHWWSLFLIAGMSSFKTTDNKDGEDKKEIG